MVRRLRINETPELRARISYLFFIEGVNDSEILQMLQAEDINIGATSLARIRRKQNLWQRLSVFQRAAQENQLRSII